MINYFADKNQAIQHAHQVDNYVRKNHAQAVDELVHDTRIFPHMDVVPTPEGCRFGIEWELVISQETTVDAIFEMALKYEGKIAALNFASYKQPGGLFLGGSKAQEECLCHESWLYPVLSSEYLQDKFYRPNAKRLNKALYNSNLMYTPGVPFVRGRNIVNVDVITCAAPNKKTAQKYQNVSDSEVANAMYHRIDSLLYAAATMKAEILILGAFGCGVFGNDLTEVSEMFKELLYKKYRGCFKHVVFAIPDTPSVDITTKVFSVTE